MSRGKGHYPGGSTSIGQGDSSWFSKDSTQLPPDEIGPRPPRSAEEQAEYEALKQARETGSSLIPRAKIPQKTPPIKQTNPEKSPSTWRDDKEGPKPEEIGPTVSQALRRRFKKVSVIVGRVSGTRSKPPQ
jgi:hypothetical protein